jgi:hypothetical protein
MACSPAPASTGAGEQTAKQGVGITFSYQVGLANYGGLLRVNWPGDQSWGLSALPEEGLSL